jgi:hypothetical protein
MHTMHEDNFGTFLVPQKQKKSTKNDRNSMLSEELAEAENMHSKLADILPMH